MLKVCNTNPESLIVIKAGTGGLKKGELAKFSSGTAVAAAAAHTGATILGVAAEDAAENATANIYPVRGKEIEADIYQGGATDVFATADLGKLFDLIVASNDFKIDPNDTTGAYAMLTAFDNAKGKARFRIPTTLLYI